MLDALYGREIVSTFDNVFDRKFIVDKTSQNIVQLLGICASFSHDALRGRLVLRVRQNIAEARQDIR